MLSKAQRQAIVSIRWTFGLIFSINFLVFWALPIGVQVVHPHAFSCFAACTPLHPSLLSPIPTWGREKREGEIQPLCKVW